MIRKVVTRLGSLILIITCLTGVYLFSSKTGGRFSYLYLTTTSPHRGNGGIETWNGSTVPVIVDKPQCPHTPPGLKGRSPVDINVKNWTEIENEITNVAPGGHWAPPLCSARHRVAIVIPYRDRDVQLRVLLRHIHPFLQKQQLDYGIYVVEHAKPTVFNKAMVMNIGFVEASQLYDYQCFVFHDVDKIPEDDRNIYSCPEQPRHLAAAVDKYGYRLPYLDIFGGAVVLTTEQFIKVNGFSNKYFGWGAEDDDMSHRLRGRGYNITRYSMEIAKYKELRDPIKAPINKQKDELYKSAKERWDVDGLNSLKYKILKTEQRKLYTWIYVEIDRAQVEAT